MYWILIPDDITLHSHRAITKGVAATVDKSTRSSARTIRTRTVARAGANACGAAVLLIRAATGIRRRAAREAIAEWTGRLAGGTGLLIGKAEAVQRSPRQENAHQQQRGNPQLEHSGRYLFDCSRRSDDIVSDRMTLYPIGAQPLTKPVPQQFHQEVCPK